MGDGVARRVSEAAPSIHIRGRHTIDGTALFGPIDITLPACQWTCVLGKSGVGKTTLLRLVAGLECAGTFEGDITASDADALPERASMMAQDDLLLPWLTVLENTVLGARLRSQTPDFTRAQELLERVGLADHTHKKPAALSGGMRQRTALARTLMEDRPIVFLDEPFSALDASTRADMQDLSAQMLTGKTVLLITHDPAEAVRLGHQIILLSEQNAQVWPLPNTPPLRNLYAPDVVKSQSELMDHLRALS